MGFPLEGLFICAYIVLWITLSAGVILYNKWILNGFGFPFPVTLTMIHMALCSAFAFILVKVLKVVEGVNMTTDVYVQKIVPVAFLFSIVLSLGNAVYLYLSVAFIQMVKALMPCVVYLVGVSFKIETFKGGTMANMVILAVGVAVASYGELNFHVFGFTLLIVSILAEAIRIVSIQLLLTASDIKLNSVTTLYYVSPACFVFLTLPFVFLELPAMLDHEDIKTNPLVLLSSAVLAFALNMSVYLLIGKTSALTMNVAGVIKDWLLICISSILFDAPISSMQLLGYLLAFVAVCYYNYQKYLARAVEEKPCPTSVQKSSSVASCHFLGWVSESHTYTHILLLCAFVFSLALGSGIYQFIKPSNWYDLVLERRRTLGAEGQEIINILLQHAHCGQCIAYLESTQALAMTGFCVARDRGIFMRPFDEDNAKCKTLRTSGLCRERMQPRVQLLNETRFLKTTTWVEPGITLRTETATIARLQSTLHKYTHPIDVNKRQMPAFVLQKGTTLYLNEVHANTNIGHASRDLLFSAHVLRNFEVDRAIVHDALSAKPNEHRRMTLGALARNFDSFPIHWSPSDALFANDTPACFQVVLQKSSIFPGDFLSRDLLRSVIYDQCNVSSAILPDAIVLEVHSKNRVWSDAALSFLKESISKQEWARGMPVIVENFGRKTPCEQVKMLARSKVFIAHHGAVLQGNGAWIPDDSVIVEIISQFDRQEQQPLLVPLFHGSNINDFAKHTGISALSAAVAYSASGKLDYYHDAKTEVEINVTRWELVLKKVGAMLERIPLNIE